MRPFGVVHEGGKNKHDSNNNNNPEEKERGGGGEKKLAVFLLVHVFFKERSDWSNTLVDD